MNPIPPSIDTRHREGTLEVGAQIVLGAWTWTIDLIERTPFDNGTRVEFHRNTGPTQRGCRVYWD